MSTIVRTHEHSWQLCEGGYVRTWATDIAEVGTITAHYGGSEDWSENGDGRMYLECSTCGAEHEIDHDSDINYQ